MKPRLSLPLVGLIGATRGMIGIGLGFLLAERLARDDRRKLGFALLATGVASTVPLAIAVFRRSRAHLEAGGVMEPMTEIYTPSAGTVDATEAEVWPQAETPNVRP